MSNRLKFYNYKSPNTPKRVWVKFADYQEAYRQANRIPKSAYVETFSFVPHDADLSKGHWYVWRTFEEWEKGRMTEAQNKMRKLKQLPPLKGPRPVRIPSALTRWLHHKAMVVPLAFAASINLPRNWPRYEERYA